MTGTYDTLDAKRAYELICEVVKEAGPVYRYPRALYHGCYYERYGESSCLVGRVFERHGVSLDDLKRFDCMSVGSLRLEGALDWVTLGAVGVLAAAQVCQDNDGTFDMAQDAALYQMQILGYRQDI